MPLRLRILVILIVVVFAPLSICIYLIADSSYKDRIKHAGEFHQATADEMNREAHSYFKNYANLTQQLINKSKSFKTLMEASSRRKSYKGWLKSRDQWQSLNRLSPELKWLTKGAAPAQFKSFQLADRHLISYIVTDTSGAPLSASFKPETFLQSEKLWWKSISSMPPGTLMIRHIESTKDEQLCEVVSSLSPEKSPEAAGAYIRVVVNLNSLIEDFSSTPLWHNYKGLLATDDGAVLIKKGVDFEPTPAKLPSSFLNKLSNKHQLSVTHEMDEMATFSQLVYGVTLTQPGQLMPRFITISGQTKESAITPLRNKHLTQFATTLGIVALSLFLGFIYMRKTISGPIEEIRSVTETVSSVSQKNVSIRNKGAREIVTPLNAIHTGDEIESLAKEFSNMARKVLGFQRKLEQEVELKTKVIQDDLEMAKEFQQALLPQDYPHIDIVERQTELSLEFAHSYRPAAAVGGDFFEIEKIDQYRYAAIIADVMGHGARSALVTAILRALVDDTCHSSPEPKAFMTELNKRFCEIIERSGQTIFVTASYLLFDTHASTVSVCCAGHPSPIIFDHQSGTADKLLHHLKGTLPLGIMPTAEYQTNTYSINQEDMILLYTDGLTEAEDKAGIQFGEGALISSFSKLESKNPTDIVNAIEDQVVAYSGGVLDDDLCLLLIKAIPPHSPLKN